MVQHDFDKDEVSTKVHFVLVSSTLKNRKHKNDFMVEDKKKGK